MKKRAEITRLSFSLIELLVVMVIIMILSSISLPSLAKARERARTIHCSSNLKQIGIAGFTYIGDNQDYFPCYEPAMGTSESWGTLLSKYFRLTANKTDTTADLLHCPVQPYRRSGDGNENKNKVSYAYSVGGSLGEYREYKAKNWGLFDAKKTTGKYTSRRVAEVRSPENRLFVGEGYKELPGGWNGLSPESIPTTTGYFIGNHGKIYSNMLYCDGHVNMRNLLEIGSFFRKGWDSFGIFNCSQTPAGQTLMKIRD